ncbi:hypothetical protein MCI89_12985 [Muricomes sp. OA1]|nr:MULTISPECIES: hypothetical protein [Clostridia]MCH1973259.1 hypothetical protein [Muricomes sp. OA1]GKH32055.1 hypothetical protein CE91St64_14620 [Faecalicatena contorta]
MGIQEYLNDLLGNQLREMKYRYREQIVADIKNRMCSLLSKWDDEEYRRTILFVTDEEALFYEPYAAAEVKEFVVAALRNSMLEVAASVNCTQFKMQDPLSNEKIRQLTSDAIVYFRQCSFASLREEAQSMEFKDVYGQAIKKYPLAWDVLKKTALMTGEILEFAGADQTVSEYEDQKLDCRKYDKVICDGYSLEFDEYLEEALGNLISGHTEVFFVDSFKILTRNFEKVLHVLQIILENGRTFVTCNYYISNGYIEKRKEILRAAHSEKDVLKNLRNMRGTQAELRTILKGLADAEL